MTISIQDKQSFAGDLMKQILEQAHTLGWNQTELARRAGVPASSLSRIKRSGRADLDTLARLAASVGLRLTLVADSDFTDKVSRGELF